MDTRMRVLITDSSHEQALITARQLSHSGYLTATASTFAEAQQKLLFEFFPDLLVAHHALPDEELPGQFLANAFSERASMPVVLISTDGAVPANLYARHRVSLIEPYEKADLIDAVEDAFLMAGDSDND